MSGAFSGKVAVVTGAASGIGRAVAAELLRQGATVHALDIAAVPLDEAVAGWRAAGFDAHGEVLDCSDEAALAAAAARIGRADIVHLNAGIMSGGRFAEIPVEEWRRIVAVNQMGVVAGVRAFLPCLRRSAPDATLLITASAAGLCGFPFTAPYNMTKFAVAGLAEALAAELAPEGIHVITVFPGAVRSPFLSVVPQMLPASVRSSVVRIMERSAVPPERLARRIVAAIRKRRRTVCSLGLLAPLYLIKRCSIGCYQALMAFLVRRFCRASESSTE